MTETTDPPQHPEPYESLNEYGVPITVLVCESCQRQFTVTPALTPDRYEQWKGCTAPECPSYSLDRDVDIFFDALAENDLITRTTPEPTP